MAFKYIYGPVYSWRLGSSLGIDLLSQEEKVCNFDCIYCQLGATKEMTAQRKIYASVEKLVQVGARRLVGEYVRLLRRFSKQRRGYP